MSLTQSLAAWTAGDRSLEPELMRTIYPLLRTLAQKQLQSSGPITMQATELANEAFIKLRSSHSIDVESRGRFMGFTAKVMRNLVVDHIREQQSKKRGGDFRRVDIAELSGLAADGDLEQTVDWLALDAGLIALEKDDPARAHLVELRYFMGMSIEQAAAQLLVSVPTANRMWRFARVFLSDWMAVAAKASPSQP